QRSGAQYENTMYMRTTTVREIRRYASGVSLRDDRNEGRNTVIARYRPTRRGRPAKPIRYRGPEGRLADRLERLARHRQHVVDELERLERFLARHPKLRCRVDPTAGPRLVVDNTGKRKRTGPTEPTAD